MKTQKYFYAISEFIHRKWSIAVNKWDNRKDIIVAIKDDLGFTLNISKITLLLKSFNKRGIDFSIYLTVNDKLYSHLLPFVKKFQMDITYLHLVGDNPLTFSQIREIIVLCPFITDLHIRSKNAYDEIFKSLSHTYLETLKFVECPIIKLPGINKLTALKSLTIEDCPQFECLSDLTPLVNLSVVSIKKCRNLRYIPNISVVPKLMVKFENIPESLREDFQSQLFAILKTDLLRGLQLIQEHKDYVDKVAYKEAVDQCDTNYLVKELEKNLNWYNYIFDFFIPILMKIAFENHEAYAKIFNKPFFCDHIIKNYTPNLLAHSRLYPILYNGNRGRLNLTITAHTVLDQTLCILNILKTV
jgi:hypothetical protein